MVWYQCGFEEGRTQAFWCEGVQCVQSVPSVLMPVASSTCAASLVLHTTWLQQCQQTVAAHPHPHSSPVPCLQCYGFVTFASPADAENVLEFAKQQGIWADERMLRINWAQGSMPGWKVRLLYRRQSRAADLATRRVAATRDAAWRAALCLLLP